MAIPVLQTPYVNSHNPWEIILPYDDQLFDSPQVDAVSFSISGAGRTITDTHITGSAYNPSFVTLIINDSDPSGWINYNESVEISYTAGVNPLQNADGQCANFSNVTVWNRVKNPTPTVEKIVVNPINDKQWTMVLNRPCESIVGCWAFKINSIAITGVSLQGYGTGTFFFTGNESISYGDVLTVDFDSGAGFCTAVENMYPIAGTPSMVSFTDKIAINGMPNPIPDLTITDSNGWYPDVSAIVPAGGTIAVQAGTYGAGLYIGGFRNSSKNNAYKIVNVGGICSISANMQIEPTGSQPSEHFILCGNNHPGTEHGFQITSDNGQNALELGYCSNYEISGVEIVSSLNSGITARTNVGCSGNWSKFNWFPENIHIHDCKTENTTYEGFYIGTSHWGYGQTGQPGCSGVELWEAEHTGFTRVYNNITNNTGADGLQVGSSVENCEIFDNRITNFATSIISGHASGIQINPGTTGLCYDNFISDGPTADYSYGIFDSGMGFMTIYNNIITRVHTGMILSDNGFAVLNAWNRVHNNTMVDHALDVFAMFANRKKNDLKNNILVGYGGVGDYFRGYGGSWTESNNYTTQDINDLVFVDPLNDNFDLGSGSPAIGAAVDLAAYGIYNTDQGATIVTPNIPPVSNAGIDQSITIQSGVLDGSLSTDADGSIVSYLWVQISGPNTSNILTPTTETSVINGLISGDYVFQLTVTDNDSLTNSDTVTITVSIPVVGRTAPAHVLI